jgi:hypothetical protein
MKPEACFWLECSCYEDPRLSACGIDAEMLYIHALGRSHKTPGKITRRQLHTLRIDNPETVAVKLEKTGLMVRSEEFDGWLIPHWREHCRYSPDDLEDDE